MAVDTRNRRMAMIGLGSPVPRVLPHPDGAFDTANDRYMLLFLYPIFAEAPPTPPPSGVGGGGGYYERRVLIPMPPTLPRRRRYGWIDIEDEELLLIIDDLEIV